MSVEQTKVQIREKLIAERKSLKPDKVLAASQAILMQCLSLAYGRNLNSIHTYVPHIGHAEVDTWKLLKGIWNLAPQLLTAVPRMHGKNMESVAVTPTTRWETSKWGVPEPQDTAALPPEQMFDAIIVPMVGFDRDCYRLGYGKGLYDRFLATQQKAVKVGLCYAQGLVEPTLPHEQHDVPMDYIITEKEIIKRGPL